MTDKQLDSNIDAEREKLSNEINEETDEVEVLGYATMYTVGDVLVPRDWLLERANDLGIPDYVLPNEPRPSSAYKRAMSRLIDDTNGDGTERFWVQAPKLDDSTTKSRHMVDVETREGDGKVRHLYASVFFSEEESEVKGGTWATHHLGRFDYDSGNQRPAIYRDDDLDSDDNLFEIWTHYEDRCRDLFQSMQEKHIGHDIRQMMYYTTRDYTSSVVKLRRSVYLFPAALSDFVKSMQTLYSEIDQQFKQSGDPVAVRTIPVLNTDDKREWVRHAVESAMEDTVDKALKEAWDKLADDSTTEEVARVIRENLMDGDETAEVYNQLLETELDIQEVLEQRQEKMADSEREEIVERVLSETDFDAI